MNNTSSSIIENVSFSSSSNESTTANTALMTKMPTITPSKLRKVRKRFTKMACQAKDKLSRKTRNQSMERS